LVLFEDMRRERVTVPLIIFSSTRSLRAYGDQAISKGVYAATTSNTGLFRALSDALRGLPPTGVLLQ
jgi:hypothetical protein